MFIFKFCHFKLEIVNFVEIQTLNEWKLDVTVFSTKSLRATPLHNLNLQIATIRKHSDKITPTM